MNLFIVVCTPNSPNNINYTVIALDGNDFTASISWDDVSNVKVTRYIVYVSRANDPTTYDGIEFSDEKFKIVSTLISIYVVTELK